MQVFGRRHEEAIHALRRPASEKRQCTKSREYGTRQCSECYGDRMLVAISMGDAARAERVFQRDQVDSTNSTVFILVSPE